MKRIIPILLAAVSFFAACTAQQNKEEAVSKSKTLVLYYSQTGATKTVAEEIRKGLNADIEEIVAEKPYDGDFNQTIERCLKEKSDGVEPTILPLKSNINDYETIFIGYPIWFGTYAPPIEGLLKTQSFEGKTIVTFCTFGSGGLQSSTKEVKEKAKGATVKEGYGVRQARLTEVAEEIHRFLVESGYKEGSIEPLAPFGEHHPVDKEEEDIFNQACGDYQFPLGTPIDVAVRHRTYTTDYEYSAKSQDKDGKETIATIYVTVEIGSKPYFTQVIR